MEWNEISLWEHCPGKTGLSLPLRHFWETMGRILLLLVPAFFFLLICVFLPCLQQFSVEVYSNIFSMCWTLFKGMLPFKFAAIIENWVINPVNCAFHHCFSVPPLYVLEIKKFKNTPYFCSFSVGLFFLGVSGIQLCASHMWEQLSCTPGPERQYWQHWTWSPTLTSASPRRNFWRRGYVWSKWVIKEAEEAVSSWGWGEAFCVGGGVTAHSLSYLRFLPASSQD